MNRFFAAESSRALAIGAHPDDIEVGAGGLIARLAAEGTEVTMVVASVPTLRSVRLEEAREGGRRLGASDVVVLYENRECRVEDIPMYELVRRLDGLVGDLRPDLVVTHSEHDLHWDHGLVHRAVVSAMRRTPCDILAFLSSFEMNAQRRSIGQCFVDISSTIDTKLEAIQAHRSQIARMDLGSFRDLARAVGRMSGVPYAEALEVLRMKI
jgi:LmbE family N-acetylglucosaminyl deacetylase